MNISMPLSDFTAIGNMVDEQEGCITGLIEANTALAVEKRNLARAASELGKELAAQKALDNINFDMMGAMLDIIVATGVHPSKVPFWVVLAVNDKQIQRAVELDELNALRSQNRQLKIQLDQVTTLQAENLAHSIQSEVIFDVVMMFDLTADNDDVVSEQASGANGTFGIPHGLLHHG
jgi:hypothetical protein